jgi:hypothetical integral membrane protein (TIGR02206 family)
LEVEVTATVSPGAYWTAVVVAAIGCLALCLVARRSDGAWRAWVVRGIGAALAADAVAYAVGQAVGGTWSARTSLPLALCNVAALVAAVACWWRIPLLVELTYFWGLAGTLQAVLTPDLNVGFPHLVFFEYLVGHLGIVFAALFLVVGMRATPRPGAVLRVFAISVAYSAFVGLIDGVTGANYMFLRQPPGEWTLLRLLGPWPWYTVSAAAVALFLFTLLDLPFWSSRRQGATPRGEEERPPGSASELRMASPSRATPLDG